MRFRRRRKGDPMRGVDSGAAPTFFGTAGIGDVGPSHIPLGPEWGGGGPGGSGEWGGPARGPAGEMGSHLGRNPEDGAVIYLPFGPETSHPSYLVVNADGTVGADFSGHVEAQGLDLLAGVAATPPEDRKVRWLREADGTVVAELSNYEDTSLEDFATSVWQTFSPDKTGISRLETRAFDSNEILDSWVRAYAEGVGGATTKTIIDSGNRSNFLQLIALANRKIAFGTDTVTFTASATSAGKVINHGLGVAPLIVVPVCIQNTGLFGYSHTYTTTQATIVGRTDGSVISLTATFGWVAIG